MFRTVLFDFNGVIVDDEIVHYRAFRRTLANHGIELSEAEYFEKYIGLDDRGYFRRAWSDKRSGAGVDPALMAQLIAEKGAIYFEELEGSLKICPGAPELVRELASQMPIAICSGALRAEIEHILDLSKLRPYFLGIVSAQDVANGKPDPEGYLKGLALVRSTAPGFSDLKARECLVIEDATHGIRAAKAAGMPVVGVATTLTAAQLHEADYVFSSLAGVGVAQLRDVVAGRA